MSLEENSLLGRNLDSLTSEDPDTSSEDSSLSSVKSEDIEGELEEIKRREKELEEQKKINEDFSEAKSQILGKRLNLLNKLPSFISEIETRVRNIESDLENLTRTRKTSSSILERLEKVDPNLWTKENLPDELEKSSEILEEAEEFLQKEGLKSPKRKKGMQNDASFREEFFRGLAFNLPLILSLAAIFSVFFSRLL